MRYMALSIFLFSTVFVRLPRGRQLPIRVYTTAMDCATTGSLASAAIREGMSGSARARTGTLDGYAFVSYGKSEGLTIGNVTDLQVTRRGRFVVSTSEGCSVPPARTATLFGLTVPAPT